MWRDPMDELIEDLERIVPPEKESFGDVQSMLDLQFAIARTLQAYDEDVGDVTTRERETRNGASGRKELLTPFLPRAGRSRPVRGGR